MSRTPEGVERDPLNIAARAVLLDALDVLRAHRDALVVVGGLGVHRRTSQADHLQVAAFTSDADLSLLPASLPDEPLLDAALRCARFTATREQPGTWRCTRPVGGDDVELTVDLLVPERWAGGGRRAARIPPHGREAARRAAGLEPAVVDNHHMVITSLTPTADGRQTSVRVAGVAALLVAKAYKIRDRLQAGARRDRSADKDAGDVLRLILATDPLDVAATFTTLLSTTAVRDVTMTGLQTLHQLFGSTHSQGTTMAAAALAAAGVPERTLRATAPAFMEALPGGQR